MNAAVRHAALRIALAHSATCARPVLDAARTGAAISASRYYATARKCYTPAEETSSELLDAVEAKAKTFRDAQGDGETIADQIERSRIVKELVPLMEAYEEYNNIRKAIADAEPHLADPDPSLRELFVAERDELLVSLDSALAALPPLLLPPLATSSLALLFSINAGVGGSEAALFVEELARMYTRFAESKSWTIEPMSSVEGANGRGLREVTLKLSGPAWSDGEVYGLLMWEKGVHRVQRVPATETQGRVHTSTAAVVVMPLYADAPDAPLVDPKDVKTETMRSRGAGGQHVNKTESAIRLTHIPTGITVSMQDSRSQHQNRAWAWDVLRARLGERKRTAEAERRRESRLSQVKGADRSDKVRTYNFPQDRLTDHRIGLSVTGLKGILDGDGLEYVITALKRDFETRRLASIMAGEGDLDE